MWSFAGLVGRDVQGYYPITRTVAHYRHLPGAPRRIHSSMMGRVVIGGQYEVATCSDHQGGHGEAAIFVVCPRLQGQEGGLDRWPISTGHLSQIEKRWIRED